MLSETVTGVWDLFSGWAMLRLYLINFYLLKHWNFDIMDWSMPQSYTQKKYFFILHVLAWIFAIDLHKWNLLEQYLI